MSRTSAAKRSLTQLRTGEHERQQDDLLRARLEEEEKREHREKRRKTEENEFIATWKKYLQKWNHWGLHNVSNRLVTFSGLVPTCA